MHDNKRNAKKINNRNRPNKIQGGLQGTLRRLNSLQHYFTAKYYFLTYQSEV